MDTIGRYLILGGIVLLVLGGLVLLAAKFSLPLGRLPGDIRIERENFRFYFPRLITPDGKTIELSQNAYQQIRKLLGEDHRTAPKARRLSDIRATYGKYADKPSLLQALLDEHKAELVREEAKLKRFYG